MRCLKTFLDSFMMTPVKKKRHKSMHHRTLKRTLLINKTLKTMDHLMTTNQVCKLILTKESNLSANSE